MQNRLVNKQKGMTLISWVIVVAFVGFLFMLAVRILPVFAESHTIESVWKKMENDTALVGASKAQIRTSIMRKLKVNNVSVLTKKQIKIKKLKGNYIVSAEYEPRGNIIGKLDYIASFKYEAKIRSK